MVTRADDTTQGWRHRGAVTRYAPLAAVITGAVIVAVVVFALSAYGLYDFMWRLAWYPREMAWLGPLGVDGATVVAGATIAVLRRAGWKAKCYAWLAFATPVTLSVAAQVTHQEARGVTLAGVVGAAIWPLLLAQTVHLVIIVWRHVERPAPIEIQADDGQTTEGSLAEWEREFLDGEPEPAQSRHLSVIPSHPPMADPPAAKASASASLSPLRAAEAGSASNGSGLKEHALDLWRGQVPLEEIATQVGRSKRTVQRWVAGQRTTEPVLQPDQGERP
jgi:hypothetical protein